MGNSGERSRESLGLLLYYFDSNAPREPFGHISLSNIDFHGNEIIGRLFWKSLLKTERARINNGKNFIPVLKLFVHRQNGRIRITVSFEFKVGKFVVYIA